MNESGSGGIGPGEAGGGASDGVPFSERGFPPLSEYFVVENPGSGDAVLAGGPHPVGYRRQASSSQTYYQRNRNEYRWDYLLALAKISGDALPLRRSRAIQWRGMMAYRKSVRETISGVRLTVEQIRTRLLDSGLLTSSEQPAFPTVEITVIDERTRKLPVLRSLKWRLAESDPKY